MVTLTSRSLEETLAIGSSWGEHARAGWVVGLSGDLGAGKTHLVKGIAQGLGITGRIQSPTFALINQHVGRLPLYHLDLYRLDSAQDVLTAGLDEFIYQREGVTVIEWIERWTDLARFREAGVHRLVRMETAGEFERVIKYEDSGS